MRFLSSITLLTLLSQAFSLPPHRYEIRQLVEDRALEISEACVNATETLREHEDLATVLATTTAEVEDILFAGCEGSGNTLICQSDIGEFVNACISRDPSLLGVSSASPISNLDRGFCFFLG